MEAHTYISNTTSEQHCGHGAEREEREEERSEPSGMDHTVLKLENESDDHSQSGIQDEDQVLGDAEYLRKGSITVPSRGVDARRQESIPMPVYSTTEKREEPPLLRVMISYCSQSREAEEIPN